MTRRDYPLLWDGGICLPDLDLWLDPVRPRSRAVITHAHSDHVARHSLTFATPATARLITHRFSWPGTIEELSYGERFDLGRARLTLIPAGHVLGSAQVLLDGDFGRLLYTGDLKTRPGFTAAPAEPVPADVLVLESTFGRPRYTFPDQHEVVDAVVRWCRSCLGEKATPVLLGYALGKGQEILSSLANEGFDLVLHPSLFAVTELYRELGCAFPAYRRFEGELNRASVLLCPPRVRSSSVLNRLPHYRTAALTGWAVDGGLRQRLGVDAVFPLSDHADFVELCRYARQVGAGMTYTVLGFDEDLAEHLRRRGIRAQPLRDPQQLSLF